MNHNKVWYQVQLISEKHESVITKVKSLGLAYQTAELYRRIYNIEGWKVEVR